MKIRPQSRQSNLVVQNINIDKEMLIYDLLINKAFCLNSTSTLVWQLSDGKNSISEISILISKKLKTHVSEEFVWLALDTFKKNNLLDKADEFDIDFNGLTRREIIKNVGLTSMLVLPLISSIVAPQALIAQSVTGGLGSFCSSPPDCQNGNCITVVTPFAGTEQRCCVPRSNLAPNFNLGCTTGCGTLGPSCCSGVVIVGPVCRPDANTCACA